MRVDTRPVQWAGVAVIVAWMAVLGFVLPRVVEAIPREEVVAAGQPVTAGVVTITPATGWARPKDAPETILILRKGGAQITGFPPAPATSDDPVVTLKTLTDAQLADPAAAWKVGDPTTFQTAAGADGAYAAALKPKEFITQFVIAVGDGRSMQVSASGTDTDWATLHNEIVEMVKTIEIAGGGA
jgi:hypothetical protein